MTSNATAPAVPLVIAGKTYKLRFDFQAISDAEELLDQSLLMSMSRANVETPKISRVRAMFFASVHADDSSVTVEQAKALVNFDNIVEVWNAVMEAWTKALAEPEAEEDSVVADPIPSQG